jgi:hypothetical protein
MEHRMQFLHNFTEFAGGAPLYPLAVLKFKIKQDGGEFKSLFTIRGFYTHKEQSNNTSF